ncbi:class I SAM-dependent methyltransferase [Afifella pfennigii]|uniref:class I SAM-dependent methyltransferase n=1 Tax=Afifella pfennigii TaxID=209897 RepID=UPI000689E753|nr:methyltransferase domain-containing protein [Afifella pfennigii]
MEEAAVADYYSHARREVLPFLPERSARLLDLGCGAGATVAAIRGVREVEWAGGVELDPKAAAIARTRLDHVEEGRLEEARLEEVVSPGSLDLILCLDILEHLVDPWAQVRRLSPLLGPGGRLIVSVPNIRHWKFIWRLLTKGDFRYREAGLLDATHLRFFTYETATELATAGGLELITCRNATRYGPLEIRRWLAAATGGRADKLLAKQFIVVAGRR